MGRARALLLASALLVVGVLAAAGHAAASIVTVDSVPGQILDADATRILFRDADQGFSIKDRASGQVTKIAIDTPRNAVGGFLTSRGALLAYSGYLYEWHDGTATSISQLNSSDSLRVAGDYAIWNDGNTLYRRTISTTTTTPVALDAGNTQNDVAANGDVVYWTFPDYSIRRVGTPTPLESGDESHWDTYPRTDGTTAVWRETGTTTQPPASLHRSGAEGPVPLLHGDTTRYVPRPDSDYSVAGGWIAYTQELLTPRDSGQEMWLRAPGGAETDLGGGTSVEPGVRMQVGSLTPDGELLYTATWYGTALAYIFTPGGSSTYAGSVPFHDVTEWERGYANHFLRANGHWYGAFGGDLRRVATADTAPGTYTTITSAPSGDENPSHATFEFSSSGMANFDHFQCSLDGGAYADCESPATFTSLAGGPHTLAVRSVDSANNAEIDPAVAAWGVERDQPALGMDGPDDFVTNDRTPTFGGPAGTATEDSGHVTLSIYRTHPGGLEQPAVRTVDAPVSGGRWSATAEPALPDGRYDAIARQTDAAGNTASVERLFTVDATPPTAGLSYDLPVLTGHPVQFDARGSTDASRPGDGIVRYQWDLDGDGDFERDTGTNGLVSFTYRDTGMVHPAVRVTDAGGNHDDFRADVTVAPAPPPGLVGVTINDGDRFTNDPNVFVSPVWPAGQTHILLANDGGFRDAVAAPLAIQVPWRLDSSGPERLPKTIYARFSPNGTTYQDDIILDETAPVVTKARVVSADHLLVKGRDRTAGVSRMQITTDRHHPGHGVRYRKHVKFDTTSPHIFVRLRDRAGNWSHWRRCRR